MDVACHNVLLYLPTLRGACWVGRHELEARLLWENVEVEAVDLQVVSLARVLHHMTVDREPGVHGVCEQGRRGTLNRG